MNRIVELSLDLKSADAAVQDGPAGEVARILRDTADRIEAAAQDNFAIIHLRDLNGNRIGTAYFSIEEDAE